MRDEREPPTDVDRHAARRLLDQVAVFTRPCDLDLAVFFARHPRSLLSSDSLSAFLGYDIKAIAASLDVLIAAGLLRRRQTSAHAARLYELTNEHSSGDEWLDQLMALASTRHGRLALLEEIARQRGDAGAPQSEAPGRPGPRRIERRRQRRNDETKTG